MSDAEDRAALLKQAESQSIPARILELIKKNLGHFGAHLNSVEKQERYLIGVHLEKRECPWCDSMVSFFECVPEDKAADYRIGYGCGDMFCPECKKRVVQQIPFIGSWFWGKHPDDKNPNRRTG